MCLLWVYAQVTRVRNICGRQRICSVSSNDVRAVFKGSCRGGDLIGVFENHGGLNRYYFGLGN